MSVTSRDPWESRECLERLGVAGLVSYSAQGKDLAGFLPLLQRNGSPDDGLITPIRSPSPPAAKIGHPTFRPLTASGHPERRVRASSRDLSRIRHGRTGRRIRCTGGAVQAE